MLTLLFLMLANEPQNTIRGPHCHATVETDVSRVAPGQEFRVAVRFKLDPGWHIYWKNPGDSGMATSIRWSSNAAVSFGPIQWPAPIRFEGAGMVSFGYKDEVRLISRARAGSNLQPGSQIRIEADVAWLACEEACIPGGGMGVLTLDVVRSGSGVIPAMSESFDKSLREVPKPLSGAIASKTAAGYDVSLPALGGSVASAFFFPAEAEVVSHSARQIVRGNGALSLSLAKSEYATREPKSLEGVVVVKYENGKSSAFEISAPIRD